MATVRLADAATVAACDAIVNSIDTGGAGTLELYTGSLPADPDAAPVGTLLRSLPFSATAFGNAAVNGANAEATAAAITPDATGPAGTVGWFRVINGGSAVVFSGDVSTVSAGTGALQLDNTVLTLDQQVSISSFVFAMHRDGTAT